MCRSVLYCNTLHCDDLLLEALLFTSCCHFPARAVLYWTTACWYLTSCDPSSWLPIFFFAIIYHLQLRCSVLHCAALGFDVLCCIQPFLAALRCAVMLLLLLCSAVLCSTICCTVMCWSAALYCSVLCCAVSFKPSTFWLWNQFWSYPDFACSSLVQILIITTIDCVLFILINSEL